jgi:hypothetical protein
MGPPLEKVWVSYNEILNSILGYGPFVGVSLSDFFGYKPLIRQSFGFHPP